MPEQDLPENIEELLAQHAQRAAFSEMFAGAATHLTEATDVLQEELKQRKTENIKLKKLAKESLQAAERDALTSLLNRRGFPEFVYNFQKENFNGVIMHLDVDDFKEINDSLGHAVGDKILKAIARYLEAHVRPTDGVCRWGGDEFVLYFPGATEQEIYEKFGEHDKAGKYIPGSTRINIPFPNAENPEFIITFSGGIAHLSSKGELEEAVANADIMLYQIKKSGKSGIEMHGQQVGVI